MRISVGRSEKWKKGPALGPGPVSQLELNAACIGEDYQELSLLFDQHGRRHSIEEAYNIRVQEVFETAMAKIRQLMHHDSAKNVDIFRRYDTNRSRTLDIHEFLQALEDAGIILNAEQAQVIFNHFDPNGSGEIDYGELLWGFFYRKAFLKRWRLRKNRLSRSEICMIFFKYDRTGRGALSLTDFQLAMEGMGFKLSETDVKMLGLKFDRNHDGFIDYKEFEQFLDEQTSRNVDPPDYDDRANKSQNKQQKDTTSKQHNDIGDLEKLLKELKELNSTQEEIRKILPKK
jgi:Ca2+-binding EF-hand superfamily protein